MEIRTGISSCLHHEEYKVSLQIIACNKNDVYTPRPYRIEAQESTYQAR